MNQIWPLWSEREGIPHSDRSSLTFRTSGFRLPLYEILCEDRYGTRAVGAMFPLLAVALDLAKVRVDFPRSQIASVDVGNRVKFFGQAVVLSQFGA